MASKLTKKQLKAQKFKSSKKKKTENADHLPEEPVINSEKSAMHSEDAVEKITLAEKVQDKTPVKVKTDAKKRYIAFAGNLSYMVTKEALEKFFSKAGTVKSVRLLEDKVSQRPKGFAFIEFSDSQSMQNALKLHHEIFMNRKINVELTSGGGGSSEKRISKIKQKNEKQKEENCHPCNKNFMSVSDWFKSLRPPFLDITDSFVGIGRLLLEGDSFLDHLLNEFDIDFDNGGQFLQLIYCVESYLDSFIKCGFKSLTIVFFKDYESFYENDSWKLARLVVQNHLRKNTSIELLVDFDNWWSDKRWKQFLKAERISLVFGKEEVNYLSSDASLVFKSFLHQISFSDIYSALFTDISIEEPRILAYVIIPSRFQLSSICDFNCFENKPVELLDLVIEENFYENVLLVAKERLKGFHSKYFDALKRHNELLSSLKVNERNFTHLTDIDAETSSFISNLHKLYYNAIKSSSSYISGYENNTLADIFDGRLFISCLTNNLKLSEAKESSEKASLVQLESNIFSEVLGKPEMCNFKSFDDCIQSKEIKFVPLESIYDNCDEFKSHEKDETDRKKMLRNEQKHVNFLHKYAESLESSKNLHKKIVTTVKSEVSSAGKEEPVLATKKKEKEKPMSKADQIRLQNQSRLADKKGNTDQGFLKEFQANFKKIESAKMRKSYLECCNMSLLNNDVAAQIQLMKLNVYLNEWVELKAKTETFDEAKMYPKLVPLYFLIVDLVENYHSQIGAKELVYCFQVLIKLGFNATAFELKKIVLANLQVAEIKKMSIEPSNADFDILFQLKYAGDKLRRNLNTRPDERVLFKPDEWQVKLLDLVDRDESALISAPTSSGKTFICYYAMEKILRTSNDDIVVFVAPTKPLVNQVSAEVYARFGSKMYPRSASKSLLGVLTKEHQLNPFESQILITVPSVLEELLTDPSRQAWASCIKYVIIDEIHEINAEDSGLSIEKIIHFAKCPILTLSATIGNLNPFFNWMKAIEESKGRKCSLISHNERYCDLKKFTFTPLLKEDLSVVSNVHKPLTGTIKCQIDPISHVHTLFAYSPAQLRLNGLSNDSSFLPEELVQLYEAILASAENDKQRELFQQLKPTSFFKDKILISKNHLKEYEKYVVEKFYCWLKDKTFSPNQPEKIFCQLTKKTQESFQLIEEMHSTEFGTCDWISKNFLELLVNLNVEKKLPAIVFSLDRNFCTRLGVELGNILEASEKLKQGNEDAESKKKIDKMEKMKKDMKRKRDEEKKIGGKDAWIVESMMEEEMQDLMVDVKSVDSDLSFVDPRYKASNRELDELIDQLKYTNNNRVAGLIPALRRGIGVHHTGLPRRYLQIVEYLFRKRHLQVVIATETLALGINMPCKTVVFAGDSVELDALQYRQMSGRAGRRGFDSIGNVVFFGMREHKIQNLMSSHLPSIKGSYSFSPTTVLQLASNYQRSINCKLDAEFIKTVFKSFVTNPLIALQGDYNSEEQKVAILNQVDFLIKQGYLGKAFIPSIISDIVIPLRNAPIGAFCLQELIRNGIFTAITQTYPDFKEEIADNIVLLLSHFFEVKHFPDTINDVSSNLKSKIILPDLPKEIKNLLENQNELIIKQVENAISITRTNTDSLKLPLTKIEFKGNADLNNPFLELSGGFKDDSLDGIIALLYNKRSLKADLFPYCWDLNKPKNAYIFDFFRHGKVNLIETENGIYEGQLWQSLYDFLNVLTVLSAYLQKFPDNAIPLKVKSSVSFTRDLFEKKFKDMWA